MRLLLTRPESDAAGTANALRARGHDVMLAPLLRVELIACALPADRPGAVIMTSANAAHAVAAHPRCAELTPLAAFTVGRHTAAAARAAGFDDVRSADGDRSALVDLVRAHGGGKDRPLLYLAGEERAGDLIGELAAHGIRVLSAIAYRAVKVEQFPPAVAAALVQGELDGVLHFSRRTAQAYLDCAARARLLDQALRPLHFCLSRQISEPLTAAGAVAIKIAAKPDEAALVDVVAS
jgi:uroporphyrinogen-III synthase